MKRNIALIVALCMWAVPLAAGASELPEITVSGSGDFGRVQGGYASRPPTCDILLTNASGTALTFDSITLRDGDGYKFTPVYAFPKGMMIAAGTSMLFQFEPSGGLGPGTHSDEAVVRFATDVRGPIYATIPLQITVYWPK